MRRNSPWLIIVAITALAGCQGIRDLGTIHVEFLEGNRLILSAMHNGETWFEATGVRDTTWRPVVIMNVERPGFASEIKYDLNGSESGYCFIVFESRLQSAEEPVPTHLKVGAFTGTPLPFVWPSLICPALMDRVREGDNLMMSATFRFVDGELKIERDTWPSPIGRLDAEVALHTYFTL